MATITVTFRTNPENTTRIRNMRQYLLATLYNAPLTIGNYYRSLVSHDMSEGFI